MVTELEQPSRLVYTVDEVAVLFGISRNNAYEAVRQGAIPSFKIGRRILIPKSRLDAMLAGSKEPDDPNT